MSTLSAMLGGLGPNPAGCAMSPVGTFISWVGPWHGLLRGLEASFIGLLVRLVPVQMAEKPDCNSCKCVCGWVWLHSYGRICFGEWLFQAEAVHFMLSVEACYGLVPTSWELWWGEY